MYVIYIKYRLFDCEEYNFEEYNFGMILCYNVLLLLICVLELC